MKFIIFLIILLANSMQAQPEKFEQYLDKLEAKFDVINIDPEQLENGHFILLDTREPKEYQVSHLKQAINVGYDDFNADSVGFLDKKDTIVVYCSVGYRSSIIAEKMKKIGYDHVMNLRGGIFEWVNRKKPVYQGDLRVNKIHTYNKNWGKFVFNAEIERVD